MLYVDPCEVYTGSRLQQVQLQRAAASHRAESFVSKSLTAMLKSSVTTSTLLQQAVFFVHVKRDRVYMYKFVWNVHNLPGKSFWHWPDCLRLPTEILHVPHHSTVVKGPFTLRDCRCQSDAANNQVLKWFAYTIVWDVTNSIPFSTSQWLSEWVLRAHWRYC